MPMTEKTTQVKADENLVETLLSNKGPSEETLDFLKAFARAYHADTTLPNSLNATILN
ncbi:hypothetical protein SAMN05444362_101265 [Dysgonomonas macrotermitis]|uniref:Uncharacterized protein n=2 Tax=Dysgonomonas macrotermitis TaxID=1346286 RepID=A0A1M4T8H7_9BACT|nr:hypothetical protein SAMN05444362_101265 [Dysgonomonas macrotermitis]